jgi:hypothetical protein
VAGLLQWRAQIQKPSPAVEASQNVTGLQRERFTIVSSPRAPYLVRIDRQTGETWELWEETLTWHRLQVAEEVEAQRAALETKAKGLLESMVTSNKLRAEMSERKEERIRRHQGPSIGPLSQ